MLRLKTKVNLRSTLILRCEKHRTYNPENGPGAIRGGCERCTALYMIYNTQRKLINALRDFEQVSKPYETIKPRAPKKPVGTLDVPPKVKPGYQDGDFATLVDFRTWIDTALRKEKIRNLGGFHHARK